MDFQAEFNRHVQAAIAHTHDEDKKLILRDLLCDANDDHCEQQPEASTLDSGGGGNTNPPQPGTPTPPTRPK